MIEINLLPKSYRKKSISLSFGKAGIVAVAAAAGVVLMLLGVTLYQQQQMADLDVNIQKARQRAAMLQKDIAVVDALNDVKGKITMRMQSVDRLDSHRSTWVKVLEDIAGNVPEFVWLVDFEEKPLVAKAPDPKNKKPAANADANKKAAPPKVEAIPSVRQVKIEGYAFTLNALASFMINVMRSDYFDKVELASSEEKFLDNEKEYRAHNFVLTCDLHYLSDEELRGLIAKSGAEKKSAGLKTKHKVLN